MSGDFVLRNAGRLVTCSTTLGEGPLGVIEGGALAARDGRIVWCGPDADVGAAGIGAGAIEVDARGRAVIPGLVDCHTHLVFAGERSEEFAARMRGEPYATGGVRNTVRATRAASEEELSAAARARLDRFLAHGVTTVEAKSGYALTPEGERRLLEVAARLDHPVEIVRTFMGAHVVPEEYEGAADAYVDLVCEGMIPALGGLAELCDVWCDEGAFSVDQSRRILRAARAEGLGLKVHAEQMARSGGAVLAASFGALSADHLEHATEEDADALARARTVAVLLPGASMMTRSRFAPARMLIDRGVRVAISTDLNPGTSHSENLALAAALGCAHLGLTVEEAILGITRHAAAAIAREGQAGALEPGAGCDLAILDTGAEIDLAYHYGVNLVNTVVKNGRVVREN